MRDASARQGGLTLVLDENLSGKTIAAGLRAAGVSVKLQTELMPRGVPDDEVLRYLAQHSGHALLTKDSDFYRHQGTLEALRRHAVGAFVITGHKNKTGAQLVDLVVAAWPKMLEFASRNPPPFVARIVQGRVVRVV